MLIWERAGILGGVIPVLITAAAASTVNAIAGYNYYAEHIYCQVVALLVSAVAVFFTGRALNKDAIKDVIDVKTRALVRIEQKHTLFFIPLEYVSVPIVIFALLIATK